MQNNANRALLKELKTLLKEPMEDIHIVQSQEASTNQLEAVIVGSSGTPYEGGQFKVRLVLGADYPSAPPKGFFLTKIFHPNVSKSGDICVNTLKKDWNEHLGLKHVLVTIKCLLIHPNPESALNEEAGKLLLEDYEEYAKQARLMTQIHACQKIVDQPTTQQQQQQPQQQQQVDENADAAGAKKVKVEAKAPPSVAAAAAAKKKTTLKRL